MYGSNKDLALFCGMWYVVGINIHIPINSKVMVSEKNNMIARILRIE